MVKFENTFLNKNIMVKFEDKIDKNNITQTHMMMRN